MKSPHGALESQREPALLGRSDKAKESSARIEPAQQKKLDVSSINQNYLQPRLSLLYPFINLDPFRKLGALEPLGLARALREGLTVKFERIKGGIDGQ